jgi:16S rRNA processing protein RimM
LSADASNPTDTVVVGRIGRPHGVRGEVTVEVRTDDPDLRFVPGAVLATDPADRGPLTVTGRRWHRDVLLLQFEGPGGRVVDSREAAEEYRNTELHVPVTELPELEDPDAFYDHQVRHEGADLLVVRRIEGGQLLVPFVAAIVPTVDLAGGVAVVDPPEGLLDL